VVHFFVQSCFIAKLGCFEVRIAMEMLLISSSHVLDRNGAKIERFLAHFQVEYEVFSCQNRNSCVVTHDIKLEVVVDA